MDDRNGSMGSNQSGDGTLPENATDSRGGSGIDGPHQNGKGSSRKPRKARQLPAKHQVDVTHRDDGSGSVDILAEGLKTIRTPLGRHDDPSWATWPDVMKKLCERTTDGSDSRDPGSIAIRPDEDGFIVELSDPTIGTKLQVHVDSLMEAFHALQDAFYLKKHCRIIRMRYGRGATALKAEEARHLAKRSNRPYNSSHRGEGTEKRGD